jgi:hypothetical protein
MTNIGLFALPTPSQRIFQVEHSTLNVEELKQEVSSPWSVASWANIQQ